MRQHHPETSPGKRPEDGADFNRYLTCMKGQLSELVKNYAPGILWFDGEWENT